MISRNLAPKVMAMLTGLVCSVGTAHAAMQPLDDTSMSNATGQSAFFTDYIAPSTTLGGVAEPAVNNGLGFFTLGLQGTVKLNANIQRLQVGCGGVAGPGCDIDLSEVRLTGTTPGPSGTFADSDATLTNPFIQLAIANPTTLASRHVVGLNLGSQLVDGLLSIGLNPNPTTAGTPGGSRTASNGETGINTISGSFTSHVSGLTVPLTVCSLGVNGSGTGCGFLSIPLASGTAVLQNNAAQPGGIFSQTIGGKRLTGATLGTPTPIALTATLIGLNINVSATVDQNLIDVHNLLASNNTKAGLSLSLNAQDILWPQIGSAGTYSWSTNTQTISRTGWWLNVPDVDIDLSGYPTQRVYLSSGDAIGGVLGATIALDSINLGQIPKQNCYGNLKFC